LKVSEDVSPEVVIMSIEDPLHNKYSLVKGAARRARQLQSGAQPLLNSKSMKACRVAQDEISQGRVTFVVSHPEPKDLSLLEPEL
jgi:DNA-directed RNA polymerase subunit omega